MREFYEFFAGGGMARAGLGHGWRCLFANDFDLKKSRIYRENWGGQELKTADVRSLTTGEIPGRANLVWASFPCQDLSLAGAGAGLMGERSGTFWPFWNLLRALINENRGPELIALENVSGTLTSHGGSDFSAICSALNEAQYRVGAVLIDSALFVPQSRPRLFILGVRNDVEIPQHLISGGPTKTWHPSTLITAYGRLATEVKSSWLWWRIPRPAPRKKTFAELIEDRPHDLAWFSADEVERLISMMSDINRAKIDQAKKENCRVVGTMYRRTRCDEYGRSTQRAEVRFDGTAGCLRTPAGGSSRQSILVVEGDSVKARLISSREAARLMGLPDDYLLPENYNEAYHLVGDGVVVPVVRHLAKYIIEPIQDSVKARPTLAA